MACHDIPAINVNAMQSKHMDIEYTISMIMSSDCIIPCTFDDN